MVREGEIGKLAALFEGHHRRLYGYFMKLTSDKPLSEDMTQEVFLRILKYRHTFRGTGTFAVWMYHIARNVLNDHSKRWQREEHITGIDGESTGRARADAGLPDEAIEFGDHLNLLRQAMQNIPADKREVLILSRYQNLKYNEIAELLNCSVGAVKVRPPLSDCQQRRSYRKFNFFEVRNPVLSDKMVVN